MDTRQLLPGAMYSPLKKTEDLKLVSYDPVLCRGNNCGAVLNPFSYIDFRSKMWVCSFCGYRNALPPLYAEHITETQLPQEKQHTTIEYVLPNTRVLPPVFLFVMDTALNSAEDEAEFEKAKETIQQTMQTMPSVGGGGLSSPGGSFLAQKRSNQHPI